MTSPEDDNLQISESIFGTFDIFSEKTKNVKKQNENYIWTFNPYMYYGNVYIHEIRID